MPRYDYACSVCGENFEAVVKMTDRKETSCPKCGGKSRQKISTPQITKVYGNGYGQYKRDTGDWV